MIGFEEERIARALANSLNEFFRAHAFGVNIRVDDAGVNWECHVSLDSRKCMICCFNTISDNHYIAEYLVFYIDGAVESACGRTRNEEEVKNSVHSWLRMQTVAELHEAFAFIDEEKRLITAIDEALVKYEPQLAGVDRQLTDQGSGSYYYKLSANDRSCRLSGYGEMQPVRFTFYWNGDNLFEAGNNDLQQMAAALKCWLVDRIAPSVLADGFSWISVSEFAFYHERGEAVKGAFLESWKETAKLLGSIPIPESPPLVRLMQEIGEQGYHEKIRAGQSVGRLILSRSRYDGLRDEQEIIMIIILPESNEMAVFDMNNNLLLKSVIGFSDALQQLLDRLVMLEVD